MLHATLLRLRWLLLATAAVALVLVAAGGAATGGNFILGQGNTADQTTQLSSGVTTGPTLSLSNAGGKPAATFSVNSGTAPFSVSNGSRIANLNADLLDGLDASKFWKVGGNSVSSTGVLGTTTNQPLDVRVNGKRALRLVPTSAGPPNIIGGSPSNASFPGVAGATIAGGGGNTASNWASVGGGAFNQASEWSSTVGGGYSNVASQGYATVAGGQDDYATGPYSSVGGGYSNTASTGSLGSGYSTIAGGGANKASKDYSSVGGGNSNTASGYGSVVAGGDSNTASGSFSTVPGGLGNTASGPDSAVAGGENNWASGSNSTVAGGEFSIASGPEAFAAGHGARAQNAGSFVWADDTEGDFVSTAGNQFDIRASGGAKIVRGGSSFNAGIGAALQVENDSSAGEAGWFRIGNTSNTGRVISLVKPAGGGNDFLTCWNESAGPSYATKCHINASGTFVSGSDFAESLPARGGKAHYQAGDVLSISTTKAGQVVKSSHPFDRAVLGVYSTRPAVLGADKGGITRVGKEEIPVAITGIVPVKVTAQNGPIRPGDLLTSSSAPGRAMYAGRNPAVGTVLGKALGFLSQGQGTIRMLVMPR
jgi:hypothetical protein